MKHKNRVFDLSQIKAGGDDMQPGEFEAYASTFVREPDSYGDIVAPGAFAATLKEWADSGDTIPVLWGHDLADPFSNIGGVVSAFEDGHGLRVRGQLDLENRTAAQVYKLLKGKRVSKMSFAYAVRDGGQVKLDDGRDAYELRDLKLYEVSIVPIPANDTAVVLSVKDGAEHLADGVKAGRALSAKNEQSLRDARDAIDSVLAALDGDESGKSAHPGGTPAMSEASGHTEVNDEEPDGAKSEEPRVNPSARAQAEIQLIALIGQEGA